MSNPPAAVLWDMDGTLLDSEPLWDVAMVHLAERLGTVMSPELRHSTLGNSMSDALDKVYDAAGIAPGERDRAAQERWVLDHVAELFDAGLPWRAGAEAALDLLAAADVPMVLVTNTVRELTEVALGTLGADRFAATVCGDEVSAAKPSPEPYRRAAALVDLDPRRCLAVEDSPTGAQAAGAAGCPTLVVPSAGPVPDGPLRTFRTSLVGVSLDDLSAAMVTGAGSRAEPAPR